MKPFSTDRAALTGLALAIVLPALLPAVLAEMPLVVILKQLPGVLK